MTTDAERTLRITEWCEEKPTEPPREGAIYPQQFWRWVEWGPRLRGQPPEARIHDVWIPRYDFARDLNAWPAVHALLVEREQCDDYLDALFKVMEVRYSSNPMDYVKAAWLATPQDRSKALGAMIGQEHRACVGGEVWDGNELLIRSRTCPRCDGAGCEIGASDE